MPLEVVEGPEIVGGAREWEDRAWFPPGPQLAICLSGGKQHLADLTDDELLQVAAAARRQTSWAQARELAAIAELTQRRTAAEKAGDPDYRTLPARESVTEEVAAALTVTGNTAATLVHLAEQLTGPLVATGDALEVGRIDMAKARVICDVTDTLPEQVTRRVEAAALVKASAQTTGQLRRRIKRIAQRLAPEAIEERKREAVRQRRLELWDNPTGTADLALCDLAAEDAHGIHNKITAAAHGLKADGDTRPLHLIRADLATQLLNGAPLPEAIHAVLAQASDAAPQPAAATDAQTGGTLHLRGSASADHAAGHAVSGVPRPDGAAPLPATVTTPDPAGASAEAGSSQASGTPRSRDGAAFEPDTADAGSRDEDSAISELAAMTARRLTHLRDRTPAAELPAAVNHAVQHTAAQLARRRDALCRGDDERHGRPGYRPPASLRREIQERHATCVFPTCNQPSHRCDIDHTTPWGPGITCRCNLAPLCRRHHRLKQSPGWKLHHLWPGLLVWTTPAGAWYIVRPERR
ncbi:DUF222 domain-containing protein [Actinomadura sp. 7K507]|uniref:DUF222 domain-containing protein n=1 Tax=Actinomadura sp. 7K507 TaxID=2530365 RepID=UPI001FB70F7C|nr:DUF222 domain-containing protein [Actinomadura sp. 7K507]